MLHVEMKDFNDAVSSGTVIVDFYATWCGPCKMLSPVLEEFYNKNPDVKIIKVDVDSQQDLASMFDIMSVPTLVLFKEGKQIDIKRHFMTEEMLNEWVKEAK